METLELDPLSPEEEAFFSAGRARWERLYLEAKDLLIREVGEFALKVSKTQISFSHRLCFCCFSVPRKSLGSWGRDYLLFSFVLPSVDPSSRVALAVQTGKSRFTHHLPLQKEGDLDGEFLRLAKLAYAFSSR